MYMPLMIDIKRAIVFGGERGEGLQKTQKLALYADELLVVPESRTGSETGPGEIVIPEGIPSELKERLYLDRERRVPVHAQTAAEMMPEGDDPALRALLAGASFVTSDLEDYGLNQRISRTAAELGVICNIIDTKELCGAWFMSQIRTPHLQAAISTNGECAFYAVKIREELQKDFEARESLAEALVEIRKTLPKDRRFDGLTLVYEDRKFHSLLKRRGSAAAREHARLILAKEGLL